MEKSLMKIFNYLFHINLQIIIWRCTSAKHINVTPPLKKKKLFL